MAPPPPPSVSDDERTAAALEKKRNLLAKSGFAGTEIFEEVTDSLTALNRDIRDQQNYADYRAELERKLSQGELTKEELGELSALLDIPSEDLVAILEEKRYKAVIRRQPGARAAYEAGGRLQR